MNIKTPDNVKVHSDSAVKFERRILRGPLQNAAKNNLSASWIPVIEIFLAA